MESQRMAVDKDIVIDLIDTLHTDEAIATSDRLCKLLRDAAEEIQHLRLYIAYPPFPIDDDGETFPVTQGNG
jgi:hypothetical protein